MFLKSGIQFNCVATDKALEQTVNRDGKSKGGVIGLTLRKYALNRWLQTRHVTAEYGLAFKSMCESKGDTRTAHQELGKARLARDERDVNKMTNNYSVSQPIRFGYHPRRLNQYCMSICIIPG